MAVEKRFFQQEVSEQVWHTDKVYLHELWLSPQQLEAKWRRQKWAAKAAHWESFLPGLRLSSLLAAPLAAFWLLERTIAAAGVQLPAVIYIPALLGWTALVGGCCHLWLSAVKKALLWVKNQV